MSNPLETLTDLDFTNVDTTEFVRPEPEPDIDSEFGLESSRQDGDSKPLSAADRVRQRIKGTGRNGGKAAESSFPRAASTAKTKPFRPVPPKPREGTLVKPLTQIYTSLGMMIIPFDNACGMAVIQNAEPCAKALEALARENEAVRRAIIALTQTSAWGGAVIAHLPILLMVTVHHAPKPVAEAVAPMATMLNTPGAMDNLGEPLKETANE